MTDRELIALAEENLFRKLYAKLNRKDCQTARKIVLTEYLKLEREVKHMRKST